jgi:hypothetical protein
MSQHMEALALANEVRLLRVQLKRAIKSGETSVALILRDPPDWLKGMGVEQLLLAIRYMPLRRAHRMLYAVPIKPTATVGALTERQQMVLAGKVEEWESQRASGKRARPRVVA